MNSECCDRPGPATMLCGHGRLVVACINCGRGSRAGDHVHIDPDGYEMTVDAEDAADRELYP